MLLQKPKETPYISIFKFVTGEEIIAKVTKEEGNEISLSTPLQMVMSQRGAQFAPWMMMAGQDALVVVNRDKIVAQAIPSPELESQYESVTTGIALPQKSSILTA
jgi:hypothetical protein